MDSYDTKKLRIAGTRATQFTMGFTDVAEVFPRMQQQLEALHGRTAQAMEERLAIMGKSARMLCEDLEELSRMINAYADVLEETDQELAKQL